VAGVATLSRSSSLGEGAASVGTPARAGVER